MNAQKSDQGGYSLVEMLTVVAIVGILALVTIPNFITFYQSNKVKASMRNFTSDLRTVRSMAITRGHEIKLTFKPGTAQRTYDYYEGDSSYGTVNTWTPLTGAKSSPLKASRQLDDIIYFPVDSTNTPQTFVDSDVTADGRLDVVFYPDGRVQIPNNAAVGTITIKTDLNVPKPQYAIQLSPSGRVLAK